MRYMLKLMVLALAAVTGQCQCSGDSAPDGGPDADGGDDGGPDADRPADQDADADEADADRPDGEAAADADDADEDLDGDVWRAEAGTLEELCADAGPGWSWEPYECPEEPRPDDCCPSCRRLTCRDNDLARAKDIWGDLVAYGSETSVGIVNLETGEDSIVFHGDDEGETWLAYGEPGISSRFIIARRITYVNGDFASEAIVARRLSEPSGPDMVIDEYEQNQRYFSGGIEAYEEWVIWRYQPPRSGINALVLHNIETGEHRLLDEGDGQQVLFYADLWGDRVVWGVGEGFLREHRISTGVTRNVLERPELDPMFGASVWQNYAIFRRETSGEPWNVYLVDLDTAEVRRISPHDSNQDQAELHGGRVVWTDFRGSDPHFPTGMHIVLFSIETEREYMLNPSGVAGSEPFLFGRNVVWNGLTADGVEGIWTTRIGDI